ncbi:hypothetical protein [Amycolatopsis lexingtonensis]|uniref:hypothetical protein n=1 Tax=Amycolatopsis lexingtonensis TaxID=218822 RepID=UPI003F6FCD43
MSRRKRFTAAELVERHKRLPRIDAAALRREADEFFGDDRLGDDDNRSTTRPPPGTARWSR